MPSLQRLDHLSAPVVSSILTRHISGFGFAHKREESRWQIKSTMPNIKEQNWQKAFKKSTSTINRLTNEIETFMGLSRA